MLEILTKKARPDMDGFAVAEDSDEARGTLVKVEYNSA